MKKILLFFILIFALTVSVCATEFEDMPDNWSTAALQAAVDNGLMAGSGGYIYPDNQLTRAEMATIVTRAFGADVEGDISSFKDVPEDKWYYSSMAKAYAMGIFQGDAQGNMNPENPITRQEAFVVLARAFSISAVKIESVNKFPDAGKVASWALSPIAGLIENGYISGSNGYIKPLDYITRAEFAQLMYNLVKVYVTLENNISGVYDGNVIIKEAVSVSDVVINGDVVICDGVKKGVDFKDVTINGRLLLRGGNGTELKGNFEEVIILGDNIKVTATFNTIIDSEQIIGSGSKLTVKNAPLPGGTVVPDDGDEDPGDDDNDGGNSDNTGNSGDTGGSDDDTIVEDDEGGWTGWY